MKLGSRDRVGKVRIEGRKQLLCAGGTTSGMETFEKLQKKEVKDPKKKTVRR